MSRLPDSSPARTVSMKVTGNSLRPRSVKDVASDRPLSTSLATCSSMRLRGLSVILSAISSTVREMGMPARSMTENWLHISVKALSLSLLPPMSRLMNWDSLPPALTSLSWETMA